MSFYSSGNSFQRENPIVFGLIAANVAVFILQKVMGASFTNLIALHYFTSPDFKPYQLITSFFAHSPYSFTHILFNMFCLFTFGGWLEKAWGSKRFFTFYMICGVGASIIMLLMVPYTSKLALQSLSASDLNNIKISDFLNEQNMGYSALGASGAIFGVEAAFAYLSPNTELMMMFIPVPIKAKYLIPGLLLIDLFGGFSYRAGDNVGHFAHLGGALVGFLLAVYWNKTNRKTFY